MSLADPREAPGTHTPQGSKFFHFHSVFSKKNCKIIALLGVGAPPRENPGSATECGINIYELQCSKLHMKHEKISQKMKLNS